MKYEDYPKWMTHPGYAAAQVGPEVTHATGFKYHEGGKPVQMPPIQVNSPDDEEYYASRGYVCSGFTDPVAYIKAHAVAPEAFNFKPQDYPKWADLPESFGRPGEQVCVNSEEEELALLDGVLPVGAILSSPVTPPYVQPAAPDTRDAEIVALKQTIAEMQQNTAATLAEMQKQFVETMAALAPSKSKGKAEKAEQEVAA